MSGGFGVLDPDASSVTDVPVHGADGETDRFARTTSGCTSTVGAESAELVEILKGQTARAADVFPGA